MDVAAPELLRWLEGSQLGLAIRQSTWLYPAANVGHVVAVAAFAAAVALLDLTLLGIVKARQRARLLAGARTWAICLVAAVAVTGATLFAAEASHVAQNRVFQVKMALIAAAAINAWWLGGRAVRAASRLPDDAPLPTPARVAGALSLLLWLGVIGLGRFIAYV